jgi:hypothetical protein
VKSRGIRLQPLAATPTDVLRVRLLTDDTFQTEFHRVPGLPLGLDVIQVP